MGDKTNPNSHNRLVTDLGAPDYQNLATFQQLWDALGSKLVEAAQGSLTFNQGVTG